MMPQVRAHRLVQPLESSDHHLQVQEDLLDRDVGLVDPPWPLEFGGEKVHP